MLHRKGVAGIAACAVLACTGLVRAQVAGLGSGTSQFEEPLYLQETQPAAPAAPGQTVQPPPPPPKPLMAALTAIGIGKPLSDAGITFTGYIEGGYTIAARPYPTLAGRVFDTKNEKVVLDQADISVDRPVDYAKAAQNHTIDLGGHVDFIYGWDTGIFHSNGIFDNSATLGVVNGYYRSRSDPENQMDFTQAYIDLALPVGSGLRLRFGKFVTLLGYEVINPTLNPLYSHSYMFGYAIPFTQTGVIGEYKLNDDWLIDAGITRGWNQSLNDNNGDPDFLGGITFTPQENDFLKKWKFILNLSEGPQATHDNSDWWTVLDFQAVYTVNDKLTTALNIDYGDAPHALGSGPSTTAQWFGVAGYGQFTLNDYLSLNARAEWYNDNKGYTLGVGGGTQNLYEFTLGVPIKPFPHNDIGQNLAIRPEVRYDYSEKRYFAGGTVHDQFTFGIDAYFVF